MWHPVLRPLCAAPQPLAEIGADGIYDVSPAARNRRSKTLLVCHRNAPEGFIQCPDRLLEARLIHRQAPGIAQRCEHLELNFVEECAPRERIDGLERLGLLP